MTPVAWVDGALVPRDAPAIPVDDAGFKFGAACFETMLARRGRVFRVDAHLARLERGLRAFGISPPARAALRGAITAVIEANRLGRGDASVRLAVSAGDLSLPDLGRAGRPRVVVVASRIHPPAPAPLRLRIASVRLDERRAPGGAKTAQFAPYLLARAEARAAGADDALLLNRAGAIAESAVANVFFVGRDGLWTPRTQDGPVAGVTACAVTEIARGIGLTVVERRVRPADLERAAGAFLTNSLIGVQAVSAIAGDRPAVSRPVRWRAAASSRRMIEALGAGYAALVDAECR